VVDPGQMRDGNRPEASRGARGLCVPAFGTTGRGELPGLLYRVGRAHITGALSIEPSGPTAARWGLSTRLQLCRGCVVTELYDPLGRRVGARLAHVAALPAARWTLDAADAPPPATYALPLTGWARRHLERQVDAERARLLARELAGARLSVDPVLSPDDACTDDTDRRILSAMRLARSVDEIATLARAPRFRLLSLLYVLREIGALQVYGQPASHLTAQQTTRSATAARDAWRVLGVAPGADPGALKRAYRRLVRALHPDLQPAAGPARRRSLERELARVSDAYQTLAARR
jgi:DnaJ-domain-containing protein 1